MRSRPRSSMTEIGRDGARAQSHPPAARRSRAPVNPVGPSSPRTCRGLKCCHELTLAERQCACGCGARPKIGADVSEQIDYVPAKVQVLRHVRVKYACNGCEQCVKTAALPDAHLAEDQCLTGSACPTRDQQIRRLACRCIAKRRCSNATAYACRERPRPLG